MLYPDLDKGLKETGCKSHVRKAVFILKTHMHFKKQSHFISYNLLKKKNYELHILGRPSKQFLKQVKKLVVKAALPDQLQALRLNPNTKP